MESLFAGVRDRRQPTPDPSQPTPSPSQEGRGRQETGEMEITEEVVGKIVPRLFCYNRSKILALCSSCHRKTDTFLDKKMLQPISVNAFRFNQQALINLPPSSLEYQ
ncbi:MAG: hypothetical protein F6K48_24045 [Okeania sp. SIO3H1]|uniref:hypothetical protein n=1 Tax=Okeania sp. SIO1I7 TaxID=2607772 RepID=UPI0013C73148|nr:hypothetical protein [Okeania sp. SIO1I7]NEN91806.1 hypothetical protein [Okeania sp. SIO3H1]NET28493.1 hypothetical protein [Okeania sp. SIO1I7]